MDLRNVAMLVVVGVILGVIVFYIKSEGDRVNEIMADLPQSSYESCVRHNEFKVEFALDEDQVDCEKELENDLKRLGEDK